jgi:hypothetical protein
MTKSPILANPRAVQLRFESVLNMGSLARARCFEAIMNVRVAVIQGLLILAVLCWASVSLAGNILEAHCTCGYAKTGLFVFAGKANYRNACMMPAMCKTTGEIVLVNILADPKSSSACAMEEVAVYGGHDLTPLKATRDIAVWSVQSLGVTVKITDGYYPCPRCGNDSLRFRQVGFWD